MHREKKDEEAGMECDMIAKGERYDDSKSFHPHFISEPEFVNVSGAQESIPPAYMYSLAVRYVKYSSVVLSYRPARLGIDFLCSLKGLQIRALYSVTSPN
jgi:hypothetical protein